MEKNMPGKPARGGAARIACLLLALGAVPTAGAVDRLAVLALFEGQALLHVDGERRLLAEGQASPEGVVLLEADSERAVVEVDGEREVLALGMATRFPGAADDVAPAREGATLTLWAEDDGFFYAPGEIHGEAVRFLVDTGANTIAMNRALAERIGLDFRSGRQGVATTASGVTPMYLVTLERVSIGGITLRDVEAGVLLGNYPTVPLLGMSFLDKLDMNRSGDRLSLQRR